MSFVTKHLESSMQTLGKARPEDLTADEKRLILEGSLGYCEAHHNLYRKISMERMHEEIGKTGMVAALTECPLMSVVCKCDDPTHHPKITDFSPCKEW